MSEKEIRERFPDNGYQKTVIGETPEGGAFSVLRWSRSDGTPCKEKDADLVSITVYSHDGERINLIEDRLIR